MELFVQVEALIFVVHACMLSIEQRVVRCNARPYITYAPMFERDNERMTNLNYIYSNNGVYASNMLRVKIPFKPPHEHIKG